MPAESGPKLHQQPSMMEYDCGAVLSQEIDGPI